MTSANRIPSNMAPMPRSATNPKVIIWAPVGRDSLLAAQVLHRASIDSQAHDNVDDICSAIRSEDAGLAILAEEALSLRSIEKLRETLEQQPPWSDLPLILLTGGGNSTEASLNRLRSMRVLGNITLLERPLRGVTLVAAVEAALASRRRQFQSRDYIRALQEAQSKLAQANADLKQFAFAASHDLQEPLRMVNVFTQMLLSRHIDQSNQEAQEFAGYVRTGVLRMDVLLRDLLLYSRAIHEDRSSAAGSPTPSRSLESALSDAIATLKIEIESTDTRILSGAMPFVKGEQTQLSLVFQNLISNSIKYAKPGLLPLIEITTEQATDDCLVRVKDNGIGFEQQYAERVVALFQRLDNKVPGTGLGLALCRRIVERHGGRMWAQSEAGAGSTFLFTIPLHRA